MNPWMQITGWMLIHFVWQGGLLALATAAGLQLCRRAPSATRYAIACTGLTAMLASPVMTAAYFSMPGAGLVQAPARPAAVGSEVIVPRRELRLTTCLLRRPALQRRHDSNSRRGCRPSCGAGLRVWRCCG
jgi:hypothetical protein